VAVVRDGLIAVADAVDLVLIEIATAGRNVEDPEELALADEHAELPALVDLEQVTRVRTRRWAAVGIAEPRSRGGIDLPTRRQPGPLLICHHRLLSAPS